MNMCKTSQENINMRLVYVIPSFSLGGLESQLLQQVTLLKDSYQITVIALYETVLPVTLRAEFDAQVQTDIVGFKSRFDIGGGARLWNLLRQHQPEIVIASTFPANALTRLLRPFLRYKSIAREHNVYPERTFVHNLINHILAKKLFCDVYLANSKEAARAAEKQAWLKKDSVQVIENGIDMSVWEKRRQSVTGDKVELCRVLGLPTDKKIILNVARYKKKKNQQLLLEAFALLCRQRSDVVLVLVGGGEQRSSLEAYAAELQVADKTFFFDRRKDIEKFYSIADVFALTSESEGFPNVLLEAIIFGIPIVSTVAPGVRAVVDSTDIGLVTNADAADIAAALLSTLEKTVVSKPNATQCAKGMYYNVTRIIDEYIHLITEITESAK